MSEEETNRPITKEDLKVMQAVELGSVPRKDLVDTAKGSKGTVYILGDFIWAKESEWMTYIPAFQGNKVLILGNHDPKELSLLTQLQFHDIARLKEIKDGDRHVILCHYPIPFHRAAYYENCYMLYGHVHMTREFDLLQKFRKEIQESCAKNGDAKGNFINVGCMLPYMDYTPRTLDEIIEGDMRMNP